VSRIETKLRHAGIEPAEVLALVKLGCGDPPEEQARRAVTLVEACVIGTDEDPIVSEPALDVIFGGVRTVARTSRATRHYAPRFNGCWMARVRSI
jgi:hypothetical protein